jgi:hypothetical protein
MKVFTQDMHLVIDGEHFDTVIGVPVPKRFEKWFEENCMHFVKEVKGKKPVADDGARKSPADKMASMPEASKK